MPHCLQAGRSGLRKRYDGAPLRSPAAGRGGIAEDLTRGHADPSWGEGLDRALDHLVGTMRHKDGGAAMGEEIVNDLKNRLAIVEWRDLPRPPPATASWQIPGSDLHRVAKYEPARGPRHLHHLSPLLPCQPLFRMSSSGS